MEGRLYICHVMAKFIQGKNYTMANVYLEMIYSSEPIDLSETIESCSFKSSLGQIMWQSLSGRRALRLISLIRILPHNS